MSTLVKVLPHGVRMPPKCERDDGSPAKAPTHPSDKHARRENSPTSQSTAVTTSTATEAVASSTSITDVPPALSAEDDPSLVVDYNESTPLPSSMSDEDSERMWYGDGAVKPTADDHNAPVTTTAGDVVASMPTDNQPSVVSSVQPSTTTIKESAAHEGAVASTLLPAAPEVIDVRVEVSDLGAVEHKAQHATLYLGPSVSQARRLEGRYASGGVPPMPPPSEWPTSDGSGAALLATATIDVHKYYGVFYKWKSEGKMLGRICPIPVVLFPNETTDRYEAAFLRRSKPHADAVRQRSQRLNFALERARFLTVGNVPPTSSRYAPSAGPTGPSGASGAGVPARKQQPAQARRRAVRQPVPKSQNSGGILCIGQGYEASASSAGGQPAFQQGSVGSLPRPPAMVAPDTSVDFARLIATHATV